MYWPSCSNNFSDTCLTEQLRNRVPWGSSYLDIGGPGAGPLGLLHCRDCDVTVTLSRMITEKSNLPLRQERPPTLWRALQACALSPLKHSLEVYPPCHTRTYTLPTVPSIVSSVVLLLKYKMTSCWFFNFKCNFFLTLSLSQFLRLPAPYKLLCFSFAIPDNIAPMLPKCLVFLTYTVTLLLFLPQIPFLKYTLVQRLRTKQDFLLFWIGAHEIQARILHRLYNIYSPFGIVFDFDFSFNFNNNNKFNLIIFLLSRFHVLPFCFVVHHPHRFSKDKKAVSISISFIKNGGR